MTTYLICHGAWSGGWSWRRVATRLRALGHEVHTPTYTGLGDRAHLTHPMVDLETHIQDILSVIHAEDLSDFVLVGHSYGGMVVTGVADRLADRIRHLVSLDAFLPADGQSLNDLTGRVPDTVEGFLVPPNPPAPDTAEQDLAWTLPRRRHQPSRCFSQKLRIANPAPRCPRTYIHCAKKAGHDTFGQFADRLRDDPAWRFVTLQASHSPNITAPDALVSILSTIG
jgi:pimeloyl-ACP methyl ester carboxylesterase